MSEPVRQLAPSVDALELQLPATTIRAGDPDRGGKSVGYIEAAPSEVIDALDRVVWLQVPDVGQIARIELHSPDATGLRVELTDLGAMELRVYPPEGESAFGPYTRARLSDAGTWWSTVIFGEWIGLEFRVPTGFPLPEQLPEIRSVAYLYGSFETKRGIPPMGECDPDISCFPNWRDTAEDLAVGAILYNCGDGLCQGTGALLNRSGSDHCPIFMTAQHCIGDQARANTLIVIWDYKTTICDGEAPPWNERPRNDGSLLLKTDAESEWTLLGLFEPDLSGNYAGWDSNYWINGSAATGVHHADGWPKRICFGLKTDDFECMGAQEWKLEYAIGRTIPGASGSPVYDTNRRVRGTLSCDNRECPLVGYSGYGRMDVAWPEVRWFIWDMASPTYVDYAAGGDPGNDGDTERGTSSHPFDTVYEGSFCVPAGGDMYISPGNYNERFVLWRPMTLRRWGSTGVVRIGSS